CNHSVPPPYAPRAAPLRGSRRELPPLPFAQNSRSNTWAAACPCSLPVLARRLSARSAPTLFHRGLVTPPGPAVLPYSGAAWGVTIADRRVPIAPTCWHRFDHSYACDASIPPLTGGWPPALRVRNRRSLPGPMESVTPPPKPPAPHSMPGRPRQCAAASYA